MDQPAVAADAPVVAEPGAVRASSPIASRPRSTASTAQKRRALGEVDVERAVEPRALEEDGLLRQPVEPGAGVRR